MIISDVRRQAFCHIPKNGGSALRRYLLERWDDATEYQGRRPVDVESGRIYDLTHLTPVELCRFFDVDLAKKGFDVIAVIREPQSRFRSALAQYLKSFLQQRRDYFDDAELRDIFSTLKVKSLCEEAFVDHSKVYFRPQAAYLEKIEPERRDLVLLGDINQRFDGLKQENVGGALPRWLRPVDTPIVRKFVKAMPTGLSQSIRRSMVRQDNSAKQRIEAFARANIAFLEDFYSEDAEIHQSIQQ
jgi:hypothetical protein